MELLRLYFVNNMKIVRTGVTVFSMNRADIATILVSVRF